MWNPAPSIRRCVILNRPAAGKHNSSYDDTVLQDWARQFQTWRDHGRAVYCYFDNDEKAYAVIVARRLIGFLDEPQSQKVFIP